MARYVALKRERDAHLEHCEVVWEGARQDGAKMMLVATTVAGDKTPKRYELVDASEALFVSDDRHAAWLVANAWMCSFQESEFWRERERKSRSVAEQKALAAAKAQIAAIPNNALKDREE